MRQTPTSAAAMTTTGITTETLPPRPCSSMRAGTLAGVTPPGMMPVGSNRCFGVICPTTSALLEASPPVIVFAIDDLNVEFNTLIQTTQIQNTLALLNASNGGSIDVGGDITAIGLQSASTENFAGFMNLPDFA